MAVPATLDYSSLSFPVEIRLISPGGDNFRQRTSIPMTPTRGTWHDTGNPGRGANAEMHRRFIESGCPDQYGRKTYTSWHFTVDDQKAIQHLPLNEVGWHAGDGSGPGNYSSIGVEECVNSDRNAEKTRSNAAELHALLRRELNLKETVQHNHWSGKNCPATIRGAGLWGQMTAKIDSLIAGSAEPELPKPRPLTKPYTDILAGNGQIVLAVEISRPLNRDVVPRMWALEDADVVQPGVLKKNRLVTVVGLAEGIDGKLWAITPEGWRFHADALVTV